MYLMEHCLRVLRHRSLGPQKRDFVGRESGRRVQELHVGVDEGLVEVMGLGLITCGEGELVSRVHTLVERSCAGLPQISGAGGRRRA